jgi:hypothetical protein
MFFSRVPCFVIIIFIPLNLPISQIPGEMADHYSSRLLTVYRTNGETDAWSRASGVHPAVMEDL